MDPEDGAVSQPGVAPAQVDIGALYEEHKEAMWRKALRLLDGDQNRAGDAVQGAIVKVMANPPANVRSWRALLVSAVERTIVDGWRSAEHKRTQLVLDPDVPIVGRWLGDDTLGRDWADILDEVHQEEEMHAVAREALAHLKATSADAHYAYVQVKLAGRTSKEVAPEMEVSDSRVRQHISKARSILDDFMKTRGGER